MGCFLVPTTEAIVTTVAGKVQKSKGKEAEEKRTPFTGKVKWLTNLLWGGSALLAFEHIWHGEVVPWFPFLTAAANPEEASVMLHEMATAGVSIAALVTAVWLGMVAVSNVIEKRDEQAEVQAVSK